MGKGRTRSSAVWITWWKGLCLLLLSSMACAVSALETTEMTLRWNFLKLASVTFEQEFKDNQQRFEIIGKTAGPLRLVKNYDGRGLLLREGRVDDYTLEGTDGGVEEIRRIVFELGKLPRVLSFKTGQRHCTWSRQNLGVRVLFRRWL